MKKLALFAAVAFALSATSCNKEKDCECVSSYSDGSLPDVTQDITIEDGDCDDMNSSVETFGVTLTTTCTEK